MIYQHLLKEEFYPPPPNRASWADYLSLQATFPLIVWETKNKLLVYRRSITKQIIFVPSFFDAP